MWYCTLHRVLVQYTECCKLHLTHRILHTAQNAAHYTERYTVHRTLNSTQIAAQNSSLYIEYWTLHRAANCGVIVDSSHSTVQQTDANQPLVRRLEQHFFAPWGWCEAT